ncbi:hypothetical protein ABPG75_006862 [Micractinium tetrahymenae]
MASPKKMHTDKVNPVNFAEGEEVYDALSAPTFQGRGNTAKLKEPNPATQARPHKRMFDRHDASGRGHETEKKHGEGHANWGGLGAEQEEDLDLEVQASLAREAELDAQNPDFAGQADAGEEENALTLDEYEEKQAQRKGAVGHKAA